MGAPIEVKKADLVLTVEVEGELAAVRSTEIGVPPVAEVDFKIAFLAPEGQAVKKGESVLRLDTEMLERQLAEKRAELAEAQKKVEQKEIDLGMKLLDLEQQAAQARAELGRAQLKVEVPPRCSRGSSSRRPSSTRRGASATSRTSRPRAASRRPSPEPSSPPCASSGTVRRDGWPRSRTRSRR